MLPPWLIAFGHRTRMTARPILNRIHSRRRIRGRGHTIIADEAVLRNVDFKLRGIGHRIDIAPNARLSNVTISMEGENHTLVIGRDVRMGPGDFDFYDSGCRVTIGQGTSIYGASFGLSEGGTIAVGAHCLFGREIDLRNGDSHSIVDSASGRRLNPAEDVRIGDHVWLGFRVMVLKGSRIGNNTVVGAGSVVAGDIPSDCVAAGAPARAVRHGTRWLPERF